MQGPADESVGEHFSEALLQLARDKTLEVILEAAAQIKPGMTEADAKLIVQETQTKKGAPKSWHPPQLRFGPNTVLGFGAKPTENYVLQDHDIFFFDIGPLFEQHEGDVGRPFTVGHDPEMKKCCDDAEKIWLEVRAHWKTNGVTGVELYQFATAAAKKHGWILALENANGHRISDFPHAARSRGSIQGFEQHPTPNRWILEIQIRHPVRNIGAFYEDLLN